MMADQDSASDDARRTCPKCAVRMSSLYYDKHSTCSACRGLLVLHAAVLNTLPMISVLNVSFSLMKILLDLSSTGSL